MSYRVTVLMREIVGGVVRHRDRVTKLKIVFLGVFVGDFCLQTFPAIRYDILVSHNATTGKDW